MLIYPLYHIITPYMLKLLVIFYFLRQSIILMNIDNNSSKIITIRMIAE